MQVHRGLHPIAAMRSRSVTLSRACRTALCVAILLVAGASAVHAASKAAKPPAAPAEQKAAEPQVYEVTEIIPRSERTLLRTREVRSKLDADTSIDLVEFALPEFKRQVDEWWAAEQPTLVAGRSVQHLNDLFLELGARVTQVEAWKQLLATSSKAWSTGGQTIERDAAAWKATQSALKQDAPQPVRDRVSEVLAEIEVARQQLRDKTARLVEVQSRLGAQHEMLTGIRQELESMRNATGVGLLQQDSPPLWRSLAGSERMGELALSAQVVAGWKKVLEDAARFGSDFRSRTLLHCVVFVGWVGIFLGLRSRARRADRIEPALEERVVLDRSISSAFLLSVAITPILYPDMSPQAARLLFVPGLLPVLRLAPAVVPARRASLFYFFTAIFFIDLTRNFLPPQWLLARLLLLTVAGLGIIGFLALRVHDARRAQEGSRASGLLGAAAAAGAVLFAISLTANVLGNVTLAEYLVSPLVRMFFLAVVMRLIVVAANTFIVLTLRSPLAAASRIVRERGTEVARNARRMVRTVGILVWCYLALFNLGILTIIEDAAAAALLTEWQVGAASISVRDVGTFLIVLLASYMLSRVLRTLLAEEILPRIQFPRGVPDALVLLARYGVLLLGFLLALTSAGVDLSKVTLALSALGVGIGFGLQNVVNNFVSGLILVFEHPIQVGDYIEVGSHYGKVTRIGFRASILLTRDGSEVVIPNAELIGTKVTNWSLSDSVRRLRIPVPVAAGTDTSRVIELLESIGRNFPKVCTDPPPRASLTEFGEGVLKFELRCWARTEEISSIRDNLRLAIDRAFREAGITMPIAQADVHLHFPDDAALRGTSVRRTAAAGPDRP